MISSGEGYKIWVAWGYLVVEGWRVSYEPRPCIVSPLWRGSRACSCQGSFYQPPPHNLSHTHTLARSLYLPPRTHTQPPDITLQVMSGASGKVRSAALTALLKVLTKLGKVRCRSYAPPAPTPCSILAPGIRASCSSQQQVYRTCALPLSIPGCARMMRMRACWCWC